MCAPRSAFAMVSDAIPAERAPRILWKARRCSAENVDGEIFTLQFSPATADGMSESNRHKEIVMIEFGKVSEETKGPKLSGEELDQVTPPRFYIV